MSPEDIPISESCKVASIALGLNQGLGLGFRVWGLGFRSVK